MKDQLKITLLLAVVLLSLSPAYASVRTGTIVSAPVTVGDSVNTFPTAYEDEINGGYKIVANSTERDAITAARRVIGMMCYVTTEATAYRLVGGIANANWAVVSAGGGWLKGTNKVTLETISNYVGVGSGEPSVKLDVDGGSDYNVGRFKSSSSTATRLVVDNIGAANNSGVSLHHNGVNQWELTTVNFGTGSYNDFALFNDLLWLTAITVDGNTDNVGIGTTNPISTLEVSGDLKLAAMGAPTPVAGKIYYNGTTNRLNYYDNTKWIEIDPAYTTSPSLALTKLSASPGSIAYGVTAHVNMGALPSGNDSIITSIIAQMAVSYGAGGSPAHNLFVKIHVGSSPTTGTELAEFVYPYDAYNASNGPFVYTLPIPIRATAGLNIYLDITTLDTIASNTTLTLTNTAVMYHQLPL